MKYLIGSLLFFICVLIFEANCLPPFLEKTLGMKSVPQNLAEEIVKDCRKTFKTEDLVMECLKVNYKYPGRLNDEYSITVGVKDPKNNKVKYLHGIGTGNKITNKVDKVQWAHMKNYKGPY